MKRLLLPVVGVLAFISCTPTPVTFSEPEYSIQVFEDLTSNKDQLYLKANDWIIETFTNAESVIQHSDKAEGVIMGKYLMFGEFRTGAYGVTADSRIYAIIDIRVKDQKARIEIKPQNNWKYDSNNSMSMYSYSKQDAINDMKKLSESLHLALLKKEVEF